MEATGKLLEARTSEVGSEEAQRRLGDKRVGSEEASLHQPLSGTRLQAEPVLLGKAKWRHKVGYWRPEPVKHEIRRHRAGSGDKRVGLVVASLSRPTLQPSSVPPSG